MVIILAHGLIAVPGVIDIRDFGSKVIWFYVLTFLEPPKTCAEIKKNHYFRTSHDTCVLWFYI